MNDVATITMPKEEARQAYRDYRVAVKANPNKEDRAIMLGYRALAKGRAIINLVDAFRRTGLNDQGMPKLAISRANACWCHFQPVDGDRNIRFGPEAYGRGPRFITLPNIFASTPPRIAQRPWMKRAAVPIIPAPIRPAAKLENYHILWEAVWGPVPPVDPMLLRHLHGHLYAVLAVWNLTEVERAVMGARIVQ